MAKDYEVGYKKPPKHSRFKKGVSGNARGRPMRQYNFQDELIDELNRKIRITERGQTMSVTVLEGLARVVVNEALKGNLKALDFIVKRLPKQEEISLFDAFRESIERASYWPERQISPKMTSPKDNE